MIILNRKKERKEPVPSPGGILTRWSSYIQVQAADAVTRRAAPPSGFDARERGGTTISYRSQSLQTQKARPREREGGKNNNKKERQNHLTWWAINGNRGT